MITTAWEQLWKDLEKDYEYDYDINLNQEEDNTNLLTMLLYAWQKYGINQTFYDWLCEIIQEIDLSKTVITESPEHPMRKVWNKFQTETFA